MPQRFNARDIQYQRAAVAMVTSASMVYRPRGTEYVEMMHVEITRLTNRIPEMSKDEILELTRSDVTFRMLILNNQIQHQVNALVKAAKEVYY